MLPKRRFQLHSTDSTGKPCQNDERWQQKHKVLLPKPWRAPKKQKEQNVGVLSCPAPPMPCNCVTKRFGGLAPKLCCFWCLLGFGKVLAPNAPSTLRRTQFLSFGDRAMKGTKHPTKPTIQDSSGLCLPRLSNLYLFCSCGT